MADTLTLDVPETLDGARVDKATVVAPRGQPFVARDLLDGGWSIDGHPARPGDRVHTGSRIETPHPAVEIALQPEEVDFEVLFEDSALLVVDKPTGVVVHPGSGTGDGNTGGRASAIDTRSWRASAIPVVGG